MKKTVWEISFELERLIGKKLNVELDHTGTIFDRERIESDMFFDIMDLLLHLYGGKGTIDFINKYYKLRGVDMKQIPDYQEIFEEFEQLMVE